MFARLPNANPKDVVKALERAGFYLQRQQGSHATFRHPVTHHTTVVPMHTGDIARWLLKKIIKQAGLSEDQFHDLL